ncbi:MAG: hypothetical protein ACRDSN_21940, partial [Pseudonocardiaceae bacterium]
ELDVTDISAHGKRRWCRVHDARNRCAGSAGCFRTLSRHVRLSLRWCVDLEDVEIPGGRRFDHHVPRFPRASVGAVVVKAELVLAALEVVDEGVPCADHPR